MTIQTAVLIETLVHLGAEVRWSSCNIFSTRSCSSNNKLAGIQYTHGKVKQRKNIFGVLNKQLLAKKTGSPSMLLDDGGDLTALMHNDHKDLLKDVKGVSKRQPRELKL